jgi:putative hydrolase
MLKPLLDVHTHTIVSGHAYSSLQEMVKAAADMGLEIIGITEHGPSIPGTCTLLYFKNMHVVPREMYGIRLLMGCEVNILDYKGNLDLNEEYLQRLDIGIAGIHSICWSGGTKEENTAGVMRVMENPHIHIISHPGDGTAQLDFEQLVLASKSTGTLLEINNHSMSPKRTMTGSRANQLEILRLCKKHGVPVILGSDAHISFQIADYGRIMPMIAETEFPEELIMNFYPQQFLKLIQPTCL